ncbi:MAG TPA: hypothetical protein VN668_16220 [Stellaceae bacterium]|nr:hypothetical protein [Stellaceae bacterium]
MLAEDLPSLDDPFVQAVLAGLRRAAFTLEQHREEVLPISRSAQYEEIGAGRLKVTKRGATTLIAAIDAARHLALLRRESEAPSAPADPSPRRRGRPRKTLANQ